MKIIKRSGIEVDFDASKIDSAVSKANREAAENARLTVEQIKDISKYIKNLCENIGRTLNVEEIQDLVENLIQQTSRYLV